MQRRTAGYSGELAGSDYSPDLNLRDYKYDTYCLLKVSLVVLYIINALLTVLGKKRVQLSSGMFFFSSSHGIKL